MDLERAIEYAATKHEGQKRKDGTPCIVHPLKVAAYLCETGYDKETQVAGLFHDLLEDTDATEEEILALSNVHVLEAVKLLTKTKEKNSKEYIKDILANPIAKAVKNADRIHNLEDACNGDPDFAKRYAENTKQYYVGKFSSELDQKYTELCDLLGLNKYEYVIDDSYSRECAPIYRKMGEKAWMYDRKSASWEPADPYFWLDMGDNASVITEGEVNILLKETTIKNKRQNDRDER